MKVVRLGIYLEIPCPPWAISCYNVHLCLEGLQLEYHS